MSQTERNNIISHQISQENNINNSEEKKIKGSIIDIIFLGLGASSLAIVKIPYNINLISTLLFIISIGIAKFLSYKNFLDIYKIIELKRSISNNRQESNNDKYKYFKICRNSKILYITLMFSLSIYNVSEIIIHQILIFRSLGGIINIIGEYDYDCVVTFLTDSYYNELVIKIMINTIISFMILFPLCINEHYEIKNAFSKIGFNIMLYILLAVSIQSIFYFADNIIKGINFKDINLYHMKRFPLKFLQSISIFYYCYGIHFPLVFQNSRLNNSEMKKIEKRKKEFIYSILFNIMFYMVFSILGYLSVPNDVVDIVTEKKRLWHKDIVMTISRILLLPFCVFKIIINFDDLKKIALLGSEITKKQKFIFVLIVLIITTGFVCLYQNIVGYMTLIGGLFVSYQVFLFPHIIYYKYKDTRISENEERKYNLKIKNPILYLFLGLILFIIGTAGGIYGIIDIANGEL